MAQTPSSNIVYPQSPFLDPQTGRPSREWMLWLMNPSYVGVNVSNIVPVIYGGTGLSQVPANGQLLIGTGTGYALNGLTAGTGINVNSTSGAITVSLANTTVAAGSYGSGSQIPVFSVNAKGQITGVTNTSITAPAANITGVVGVANGGSGASTLTGYLKGNGTSAFTSSASIPNTDVSGLGTMSTQNIGASGTFLSGDTVPKTVTVTNGIITSIV
jgi:hypothetical protein